MDNTLPEMIELIEAQKKVHDTQVAASEEKSKAGRQNGEEVEADVKKIKIDE